MVALSRRRFLGLAGALAGALLAGCGRDEASKAPEPDAGVLAGLLAREQATIAALAGAPAGARFLRAQDERHAARLQRAVVALGGRAAPVAAGSAVNAAASMQEGVFAYIAALPRLADPGLRVLVMQLAASEAEHLAALRLASGGEPVPDAFAGFTEAGAR